MTRAQTSIRLATRVALAALLLGTVAVAALARAVPALGHPVLIIRSGSMAPTIAIGSAVILDPGNRDVVPGDVVTIRLANGTIFTHRVTRLANLDGTAYVETKGDANATVDPALTPVDQVVGRVTVALPVAGYLMAWLGSWPGLVTVLLGALVLLLALWLMDSEDNAGAVPLPEPAAGRTEREPA